MREHKKPMFQRRHYIAIAAAINDAVKGHRDVPVNEARRIVDALIETFLSDNENFNVSRFQQACGVE